MLFHLPTNDRRSTMKQCNGCGLTFGTFAELWDHKKLDCENLGGNGIQPVESTSSQKANQPTSPSSNDLFISDIRMLSYSQTMREKEPMGIVSRIALFLMDYGKHIL